MKAFLRVQKEGHNLGRGHVEDVHYLQKEDKQIANPWISKAHRPGMEHRAE